MSASPDVKAGGSKRNGASRLSAARLAAVQALYQIDMTGTAPETVLTEFLIHRQGAELDEEGPVAAMDRSLVAELVCGTARERERIDQALRSLLVADWPLERIEKVMAAVLRAGAYELMERPGVPARVIISEYVDVAHAFFQGKEISMVNGVLDRLARTLRPGEMGADQGAAAG